MMKKFQAVIDYDSNRHTTLTSQVHAIYNCCQCEFKLRTPVNSFRMPVNGKLYKFTLSKVATTIWESGVLMKLTLPPFCSNISQILSKLSLELVTKKLIPTWLTLSSWPIPTTSNLNLWSQLPPLKPESRALIFSQVTINIQLSSSIGILLTRLHWNTLGINKWNFRHLDFITWFERLLEVLPIKYSDS